MRNLVTHRDAETFPDPYAFKPERWETASKAMQAAETGFGSGSRASVQPVSLQSRYPMLTIY
jgi:cytochrome P450